MGGEPLAGFDPAQSDYDILLPFGTEVLPDITVVSGADGQTVEITNEGLHGTSTIVITAEDGVTENTFAIHFSVEPSNIAWLQSVNSDGNWSVDYDPMTTDYQIELPIGTQALPEVTFVKGDLAQTVDSTWNGNVLTLHVTAENGVDEMTYTLSYTFLKSDNAYLHSIYLNGSDLQGFVETTFAYSVDIPVGTKTLPLVEWAEGDAYQTIDTTWVGNQVSIRVTADDQIHVNTYVIDFTFLLSENALLQEITLDGNLLGGFRPTTFEYLCMLPIGTTQLPDSKRQARPPRPARNRVGGR